VLLLINIAGVGVKVNVDLEKLFYENCSKSVTINVDKVWKKVEIITEKKYVKI